MMAIMAIIKKYLNFLNSKHHGSDYDFGCVLAYLDIKDWDIITSFIDQDDIYNQDDSSKGIEEEPHLTIFYGLHDDVSDEDVRNIIDKINGDELILKINGIGCFENKEFDVIKFNVESEYAHVINDMFKSLPHTSDFPDYKPHITIAYLKKGTGKKYEDKSYKFDLPPVHKIVYSKVNDEQIEFDI